MSKPKVFIPWPVPEAVVAALADACDVRVWPGPGRCPESAVPDEVKDVDAVLGNVRWTPILLDQAPKLRIIANTSVGYDNVDVEAATARGVIVTNTPDVLTDTTADLAFTLLMCAARRVGEAERFIRAGQWGMSGTMAGFLGQDVHHATLGVVGLGRIGAAVAHRALGFHMKVLYYDAFRREDLERQFGYRYVDLDTLLRESDFVTLHVNLSAETRYLVGEAELAKMKPTAFLVNASRGGVVDEEALVSALKEGRIAGAALDVFEKEPVDPDHPLLKLENVVVAPHIGSATAATRQAMQKLAIANVLAVLQGQPPLTPVNPEVLRQGKR